MTNIIEIENLTKDYEVGFFRKRKVRALDDLSLTVSPGQIFGFLGGNGAGKTTTIKILMRLLFPTSGTARILGSEISDTAMHKAIGYCPENPYFYDYLTAAELMDYFGQLFGLDRSERKKRAADLLRQVGLDERDWNKQLRKYSKGMLQRVGIAQSLINEPTIVFLDEPMSGLDPIGRREVRELIAGLRKKGTTVFMSTHILSDVEALCDRVAILRRGKLAATGNLDELLASQSDAHVYEVNIGGISPDKLSLNGLGQVSDTAAGLTVMVSNEDSVEKVLAAARTAGGSLLSVQPVRRSLEELFVEEKSD